MDDQTRAHIMALKSAVARLERRVAALEAAAGNAPANVVPLPIGATTTTTTLPPNAA
jgi:hypothetical protein